MLLQVKRSDEISKILIDTFKKSIIEKVTEQLDLEISEFDFQNNLKTKFNFTFYDFDTFNYQKKLTDKHLDGMLFNNFTLNIVDKTGYLLSGFGKVFKGRNALNGDLIYEYMLIDDYVRIEREFFDCISVVGEYLGYNVYIEDNVSFRFIKN